MLQQSALTTTTNGLPPPPQRVYISGLSSTPGSSTLCFQNHHPRTYYSTYYIRANPVDKSAKYLYLSELISLTCELSRIPLLRSQMCIYCEIYLTEVNGLYIPLHAVCYYIRHEGFSQIASQPDTLPPMPSEYKLRQHSTS